MLRTPYVFLDAHVFKDCDFQYEGGTLKRILGLVDKGQLRLLLTDVTVDEVISSINEAVATATKGINHARAKGWILRNCKDPSFDNVFENFDEDLVQAHLVEQFREFITRAKTAIIPVAGASVPHIFEKYFAGEPPFSEVKSTSEFPSAFVLSALENWCNERGLKTYVISKDRCFKEGSGDDSRLIYLDNLAEIFELIYSEKKSFLELANSVIEEKVLTIEKEVKKEFESLDFWVEDRDGNVNDVSVNIVAVSNPRVTEISGDQVSFEATAKVWFSADITKGNVDLPGSGDGSCSEEIGVAVDREIDIAVCGKINVQNKRPDEAQLILVELDVERGIGIKVDEQ
ncbi:MAG: PIN domain-containing protein [Deltaproteobacteria bacterium]